MFLKKKKEERDVTFARRDGRLRRMLAMQRKNLHPLRLGGYAGHTGRECSPKFPEAKPERGSSFFFGY